MTATPHASASLGILSDTALKRAGMRRTIGLVGGDDPTLEVALLRDDRVVTTYRIRRSVMAPLAQALVEAVEWGCLDHVVGTVPTERGSIEIATASRGRNYAISLQQYGHDGSTQGRETLLVGAKFEALERAVDALCGSVVGR